MTDISGGVFETRKYWPYGEQAAGTSSLQRLRFASMERDAEAGPNNDRYFDHARHHGSGLSQFLSPDRLQGKILNPQSWNRYAYALNNPVKYLDPNGRAAVGFTGFSNAAGPGVSNIVRDLNGAPGIGAARLFRWQDVKEAAAFLAAEHKAHPNDSTVIVGHSYGADSALNTAEALGKQGVMVQQVVTIDPVTDKYASSNVETVTNYYQTTNPLLGGGQVYGGLSTQVENIEVQGVAHTKIDDVLGESGAVARQIMDQAAQRIPPSPPACSDSNFVGPCQR